MAFSKKKVEDRKAWLTAFEPGTFLDMAADDITYQDFVNKARQITVLCYYCPVSDKGYLWICKHYLILSLLSGAHFVLPCRPGALHPQRDGWSQAWSAQDHVLLLQEEAVQGGGQGEDQSLKNSNRIQFK